MSEKEQIIQNVNAAIPVAKQMAELEAEVAENTEKEKKSRSSKWLFVIPLFFGAAALMQLMRGNIAQVLVFAVITAVLCFIILSLKNKHKKCEQALAESKKKLELIKTDPALSWLPAQYRNPACVNNIMDYIQTGRADTMKELFNLLDEDIHRQRMENAALVGAYLGMNNY